MQKFNKGDLVKVSKDLGFGMSHFENDCRAIVIGSYKDQFGGNDTESYTLYIENKGEVSWYEEKQLTLIENNKLHLLKLWKDTKEDEIKLKSNIDWIFTHGKEVLSNPIGATLSTLGKHLGINDLWGDSGEGYVYFENSMYIIEKAKPFLENNDKDGWLKLTKE